MNVELEITNDTAGFVFENALNQSDIDEIKASITLKIEKYTNINLYLEEDDIDDIEMSAFFDQIFFDMAHADKIKRIAIVSNRLWIHGTTRLKNLLVSSDVKAFDVKDRVDALCWIMRG